ncbi:uncharacterized protein LOC105664957 [Ceratitis capitata]|uniref:uncharacterized protein LOC105664957 n=1 Tax=Ceratitis capitata TaxID=7213 RepID=UPI000618965C|nr:uncharacterized protein LOC105664957 [Ceratitis capitata]XP_020713895.1 uncharacterized protein LOC105664957 [Ceratitis capitata]
MSKEPLTNQSENGRDRKSTENTTAQPLYTFYQPHLCPPPTDYMFLDDNPTNSISSNNNSLKRAQQLQVSSKMVQNQHSKAPLEPIMREQISNKEKRQQQCEPSCTEFHELGEEIYRCSVNSNVMEDIGKCETDEKDSNESVKSAEALVSNKLDVV